jgi:glycosyltransferase involved in cell wall biosynthesis
MLLSLHTDQDVKDAKGSSGYSYGYYKMLEHFPNFRYKKKKLEVVENSPHSAVQMFYMEPERYIIPSMVDMREPGFKKFYNHQYKILGTHLEATKAWSHWIDSMNSVDEIWVGNYFAQDAVLNSGVKTPTYVFEHGIDSMWKPRMRGKNGKVKFLHVDSGSPRKRADLVEKAFKDAFGNNPNAQLTLKYRPGEISIGIGIGIGLSNLLDNDFASSNIVKIDQTLSQEEMIQLYYDHDVLVYPSEGEGFGFIPLQALATGMPVISTSRWCSYEKYLGDNIIESTIGPTKSTGYFEGEVVLPEYDSLVHLMKNAYENIDGQCNYYFNQADDVYAEYNWQTRCDSMLKSFIDRVGIDLLDENQEFAHLKPVDIRYTGNGSYSTRNGIRFSKDSRIHKVTKEESDSLILTGVFEEL